MRVEGGRCLQKTMSELRAEERFEPGPDFKSCLSKSQISSCGYQPFICQAKLFFFLTEAILQFIPSFSLGLSYETMASDQLGCSEIIHENENLVQTGGQS